MSDPAKSFRPIRSYVRRQGRMTEAQSQALEKFWPIYGLDIPAQPLNLDAIFSRSSPKILEIGFGMGEGLLAMASAQPEKDFIGVDVHRPGVGALLRGIQRSQLTNIRVFCADVNEVLGKAIANASHDAVHLFFPDPWPKKRHHKRRLLQADFAELVRCKLKLSGTFHMATDWQNYAEQMLEIMSSAYGFINAAGAYHYAERPSNRPLTKFEQRGKNLGHEVWDLIFIKEV